MVSINKPVIKLSRLYLIVGVTAILNAWNWLVSVVVSAPYIRVSSIFWEIFTGLVLYTVYKIVLANFVEVTK